MKTKTILYSLFFLILSLMVILLTGCGKSDNSEETSKLDVTQAYQTIEARLTQAGEQTMVPPTSTLEPLTATPTPNQEATQQTATSAAPTATFLPTFTHTPAARCDLGAAAYPEIDITIPDDTEIPAGQIFTKVWRIVNKGTCNWTADYAAVFVSGDQMGAPASVAISKPTGPGQSVDISVNMTAPLDPGTYRSYWKLRNANGEQFGIGPNGNDTFWVQIKVVEPDDTPTPTVTSAPAPQTLVNGSVTLNASDSVDLDTLQVGTGGADLSYQQITDGATVTGHQLAPIAGATTGIFGSGQPTYSQCQNTAKSAVPIDLEANSGAYICYLTNQGLTGWARVDALDTDNGVVTITILTWAALQ